MAWYDELLRTTTTADVAVRLFRARGAVDVMDAARRVNARTLVIHAREDRVVPVEEGRLLASLIPGARLVVLDSANHILLAEEPAWEQFLYELREFLGTAAAPAPAALFDDLSPRELEVLGLVAAGIDQRGDRRATVPQRAHGRAPSFDDLREAAPFGQGGSRRGCSRVYREANVDRLAHALNRAACIPPAERPRGYVLAPMTSSRTRPRIEPQH